MALIDPPKKKPFPLYTIIAGAALALLLFLMYKGLTELATVFKEKEEAVERQPEYVYTLYRIKRVYMPDDQYVDIICLQGFQYALFKNVGVIPIRSKFETFSECPPRTVEAMLQEDEP